ncbi:hypothetical protein E3_1310 [Rhodococcus phage E3]|uniref:hypothetical protein n=1 Tax=Rhodococcus phage E3 TaxID=1007869 RepID=UPI0002C6A677|nr:hypothetical protein M176_gp138 [Rhodococcus phage E3]AEQ21046.1 hypothetical protein E3_1310 [Rhodococcus phage E3]
MNQDLHFRPNAFGSIADADGLRYTIVKVGNDWFLSTRRVKTLDGFTVTKGAPALAETATHSKRMAVTIARHYSALEGQFPDHVDGHQERMTEATLRALGEIEYGPIPRRTT